jgi:hypothetical protein
MSNKSGPRGGLSSEEDVVGGPSPPGKGAVHLADDDIADRIRRLYTAVGESVEHDLSTLRPEVGREMQPEGEYVVYSHDFGGGLTDEQLHNKVTSIILHVTHLRDHLRKWAKKHRKNPKAVDAVVNRSAALKIVIDLADREKHGGDRRDGGKSGRSPRIVDLCRPLRINQSAPETGVEITLGPMAQLDVHSIGGGSVSLAITADVVDDRGSVIGKLDAVLENALRAWETLLSEWGLL